MKFPIAVSFLAALMAATSTTAAPLGAGRVIVTNLAPNQGIFFTPVWFAVHDGSFDIYDRDMPATPALERLAEDGATMAISELFDAGNVPGHLFDATIASAGPLAPGNMVEFEFELNEDDFPMGNLYFSYASMVVPSVS
jgi:hypothetical protein